MKKILLLLISGVIISAFPKNQFPNRNKLRRGRKDKIWKERNVYYEIKSSGGAALHQASLMGQYIPTGESINGFPVFKKDDHYLYVSTGGWWMVGSDPSSDKGWLYHVDRKPTPEMPPIMGWKYSKDGWHDDTTLTVTFIAGNKSPPGYYEIKSTGGAAQHQSIRMGQYIPTGGSINGFPVFKKDDMYLYVGSDGYWYVGSDTSSAKGWLYHVERDPTPDSPPHDGWKYWNGESWNYDTTLTVTLIMGNKPPAGKGLIILHGLGSNDNLECNAMKNALPLSKSVKVECPQALKDPNLSLLRGIGQLSQLTGLDLTSPRSWYDLSKMPGEEGENGAELHAAFQKLERKIEEFMDEGIPSENIVLAGFSQGGSLALYTALHSKHKLGGIIGVVTWLPLISTELPSPSRPVNSDTPIFHINAEQDIIVPPSVGQQTNRELSKVIPDYTFQIVGGSHITIDRNPCTWPKMANWLWKKGLLQLDYRPSVPTCGFQFADIVEDSVENIVDQFNEADNPVDEFVDNFSPFGWF